MPTPLPSQQQTLLPPAVTAEGLLLQWQQPGHRGQQPAPQLEGQQPQAAAAAAMQPLLLRFDDSSLQRWAFAGALGPREQQQQQSQVARAEGPGAVAAPAGAAAAPAGKKSGGRVSGKPRKRKPAAAGAAGEAAPPQAAAKPKRQNVGLRMLLHIFLNLLHDLPT